MVTYSEELPKLIYKLFDNTDGVKDMVVGLASLQYVEKGKVVDILEKKVEQIKERWDQWSGMGEKVEVTETNEKLIDFMLGYLTARTDHNIE